MQDLAVIRLFHQLLFNLFLTMNHSLVKNKKLFLFHLAYLSKIIQSLANPNPLIKTPPNLQANPFLPSFSIHYLVNTFTFPFFNPFAIFRHGSFFLFYGFCFVFTHQHNGIPKSCVLINVIAHYEKRQTQIQILCLSTLLNLVLTER